MSVKLNPLDWGWKLSKRLLITFFDLSDVILTFPRKFIAVPTFVTASNTGYHVFLCEVIAMEWSAKSVTMTNFHQMGTVLEIKRKEGRNIFDIYEI